MQKLIIALNVALLVLACWLAVALRADWKARHARYAQFTHAAPEAAGGQAQPQAVAALPAAYSEIASRDLFAPDRTNLVSLKADKRPAPPLPIVLGTLNIGSGMIALMSKKSGAGSRRIREGDEFGGYHVVEVAEHKVVVEFDGNRTTLDVYESAGEPATPPAAPAYTAPAPAAVSIPAGPAASNVISGSGPAAPQSPSGSAPQAGPGVPSAGDPTVTCVAEGNRKRCVRKTPFGNQTWYEQ